MAETRPPGFGSREPGPRPAEMPGSQFMDIYGFNCGYWAGFLALMDIYGYIFGYESEYDNAPDHT